jgi:hypothetical protein
MYKEPLGNSGYAAAMAVPRAKTRRGRNWITILKSYNAPLNDEE